MKKAFAAGVVILFALLGLAVLLIDRAINAVVNFLFSVKLV